MNTTLTKSINFATAAAVVAVAGAAVVTPANASHTGKVVHCYGVNTCKGTSDCKSGAHECKGQNECKGQGFKALTAKACTKAGGSLTEK